MSPRCEPKNVADGEAKHGTELHGGAFNVAAGDQDSALVWRARCPAMPEAAPINARNASVPKARFTGATGQNGPAKSNVPKTAEAKTVLQYLPIVPAPAPNTNAITTEQGIANTAMPGPGPFVATTSTPTTVAPIPATHAPTAAER